MEKPTVVTKDFLNWYEQANKKDQLSMYNFAIKIFSTTSFWSRVTVALKIIFKKTFVFSIDGESIVYDEEKKS